METQADLLAEQRAKDAAIKQLATAQSGLTEVTTQHKRELGNALDQVAQLKKDNANLKKGLEHLKVLQRKPCAQHHASLDTMQHTQYRRSLQAVLKLPSHGCMHQLS